MSLLGPEDDKQVEFFVMESGSSVFEENSPLEREIVKKKTARLDTIAGEQRPDFLKLDVQGFELQVLSGATQILKSVEAVMMEVSLIEINKGAPMLAEVVQFMAERGFEVGDILEIHRRPLDQATNQVDLFCKARPPATVRSTPLRLTGKSSNMNSVCDIVRRRVSAFSTHSELFELLDCRARWQPSDVTYGRC